MATLMDVIYTAKNCIGLNRNDAQLIAQCTCNVCLHRRESIDHSAACCVVLVLALSAPDSCHLRPGRFGAHLQHLATLDIS
jgi:hypothetical protein